MGEKKKLWKSYYVTFQCRRKNIIKSSVYRLQTRSEWNFVIKLASLCTLIRWWCVSIRVNVCWISDSKIQLTLHLILLFFLSYYFNMFESNFCDFRPNVLNLLTKFTINQPSINMVRQIPAIFKLLSPKCILWDRNETETKQKQDWRIERMQI